MGEILNSEKFKIYKSFQKHLWLDHKEILNQKYPRMKYIHYIHHLSEGQIECDKHLCDMILLLEMIRRSTSLRMMIH